MRTHELKCDEPHFTDVNEDRKTFELRFNDRRFAVGDILELISNETKSRVRVLVTHVFDNSLLPLHRAALMPGYAILSIRRIK